MAFIDIFDNIFEKKIANPDFNIIIILIFIVIRTQENRPVHFHCRFTSPGDYPCLRSSMTFTRRYRNYLLGVYVPSSLFVVVSWASFFWPADAIPARTVLLITALLTIISLYSGVQ